MAEKSIAICLNPSCEIPIEVKDGVSHFSNCPYCGSLLLWCCPACGSLFISSLQSYCGRRICPEKDTNLTVLLNEINNKKIKPANLETLNLLQGIISDDAYKYWKEKLEDEFP